MVSPGSPITRLRYITLGAEPSSGDQADSDDIAAARFMTPTPVGEAIDQVGGVILVRGEHAAIPVTRIGRKRWLK